MITSLIHLLISGKIGEGGGAGCTTCLSSRLPAASELLLEVSPSSLSRKSFCCTITKTNMVAKPVEVVLLP